MYSVSPRQLDSEPTKEASRLAANDWWAKKQSEIDEKLGKAKKHPAQLLVQYEDAIEIHRLYAKWQRKYGNPSEAESSETMIEWLREALKTDDPPFPLTKLQADPRWRTARDLDLDDQEAFYLLWFDRFHRIKQEERNEQLVPVENTVRAYIDAYFDLCKVQAVAKGKLGTYHSNKQRLEVFRNWIDPFAPLEDINESLWERYCVYLSNRVASGEIGPATMKDYQSAARTFIRSMWEKRLIELPRNLTSRKLSVTIPLKDPVLFTKDEIQILLNAANPRQKLYLLLGLNCGMYPVDIALLRQDEVDWKRGRINRKRTKTRNRSENVPRVDYYLWRETFDLLKRYRSEHPEVVLVNKSGNLLWVEKEKNGKFDRNNNIKSSWFRLVQTVLGKKKKPLKALRKTPATILENSQYGRFAEHFLGEAPKTVASRHYTHKNGEEFDAAIKWLGKQLGVR
jgi:integrase